MHAEKSSPRSHAAKVALLAAIPVLVCLASFEAAAIDISVNGSWTDTVDQNDLSSGVGSNLRDSYTSPTNVNLVTISRTRNSADTWQVNIKRIDTTWNPSMILSARRTSSGSGVGTVSGGTSYIQVNTNDQTFFTGAGNLNNIRVQLMLSGISLQIPPNQYSTTVQYTIIDTP